MYASRIQAEQFAEKPLLNEATRPPTDAEIDRNTQILRDETHAMFMFGMNRNNALGGMPYESYRRFVEEYSEAVLQGVTDPSPLLKSMAKQAAQLDQAISKLVCDGSQAAEPETKRIQLQLAVSLTAEFRRTTAALISHCASEARRQIGPKSSSKKQSDDNS